MGGSTLTPTLVVRGRGFSVQKPGEAMEAGRVGDWIYVRTSAKSEGLRARIERQLGYKHAKYLTGIEAVASLEGIEGGNGGYWEDRGYHWYAGI